ncbi:MAG: hypothetical protein ACKVXR_10680 [Planctomycetota bacterium]
MKYRLTRDDGAEIDVPGVLWESVLERAYRNGWIPSGTQAPWGTDRPVSRMATLGDAPAQKGGRWPNSDYFSACSQYVRAADARELGAAAMRARTVRADGAPHPDFKHDAGVRKVADFARDGGFVIGRAPEPNRAS